jgi:hypothetical protein
MQGLLRRIYALVGYRRSTEPTFASGKGAGTDWLPPILGTDDWSNGLLAAMADRSSAWYFERR